MPILLKNVLDDAKSQLIEIQSLSSDSFQEQAILANKKLQLNKLITTLQDNPNNAYDSLETLLEEHWEQVKGKALSYTSRPTDALTLLLCDVATLLSQDPMNKENKAPIEYLMPGVSIERLDDEANPLIEWSLAHILKTHITSDSAKALICVASLPELIELKPEDRINPYYDYSIMGDEEAHISEEEMRRLIGHSTQSKDFIEAYHSYQLLCDSQNHLLANLNRLCKLLHIHSAYGGGLGRQENAAGGAYPAIISFFEYYDTLSKESKALIPEGVKEELDKILNFGSDKAKNINATEQVETCVADRRTALKKQMEGHEDALEHIGFQDEEGQKLIKKREKALNNQKEELITQVAKDDYKEGMDGLGFTKQLLDKLKVRITINSLQDLQHFMASSEREIAAFLADDEIKQQVQTQLNSLETLIVFLHDTSVDKIPLLIDACNNLLESSKDIFALLTTFTGVQFEAVCSAANWSDKVKSAFDFSQLLTGLDPPQRTLVLKSMKDKLGDIIKSGSDFRSVLRHLTPEQCQEVCKAVKDKLGDIIKSGSDFKGVLKNLTLEQRTAVYEAMKDKLGDIIKSGSDFKDVLDNLTLEQRTAVYEAMKDKLGDIIKSGSDFGRTGEPYPRAAHSSV